MEPRAIRVLVATTMAKVRRRAPATFARWVDWNSDCGSRLADCRFEQMGKAIPNRVHHERVNSPAGKGLKLSRGPDPRSISRGSIGT